jgi:predicted nucleic acid-binding protein
MRIYLDTCALNRPFDDRTHDRIRLEAEAVLVILGHIASGAWQWVSSDMLDYEIDHIEDPDRKNQVADQTSMAQSQVGIGPAHVQRAEELQALGFRPKDALHVACAESAGADVLLTTDDRFLRAASRNRRRLRVSVRNPLEWLTEVSKP